MTGTWIPIQTYVTPAQAQAEYEETARRMIPEGYSVRLLKRVDEVLELCNPAP